MDIWKIYSWLRDKEVPNILLLHGSPGAGKSTIASTLASQSQEESLFGSAFMFKHDDTNLCDPTIIWRIVISDLAQKDAYFADRVMEYVMTGRVDPTRVDIGLHFKMLIEDSFWGGTRRREICGGMPWIWTKRDRTGDCRSQDELGRLPTRFPVVWRYNMPYWYAHLCRILAGWKTHCLRFEWWTYLCLGCWDRGDYFWAISKAHPKYWRHQILGGWQMIILCSPDGVILGRHRRASSRAYPYILSIAFSQNGKRIVLGYVMGHFAFSM